MNVVYRILENGLGAYEIICRGCTPTSTMNRNDSATTFSTNGLGYTEYVLDCPKCTKRKLKEKK